VANRKPAVAGSWYPGDAGSLTGAVDAHLAAAETASPDGRLVGLVCPHAGLLYSGSVAAHAYVLLRGLEALTAVLVGPSHYHAFEGVALYPRGAFETPLGPVPVDEALAASLLGPGVRPLEKPHGEEHSLEMQLPFLKRLVPGARIVPLLMGLQTRDTVEALAAALVRALGASRALLVASSDLSHYHPRAVAAELDSRVVGDVERFDPEALMDRLEEEPGHACGGGPMVAVLKAARGLGARRAEIRRYADSGDAGEKDTTRVVGYLAASLHGD
jgi:AmmeMemoRadiSam system protein B